MAGAFGDNICMRITLAALGLVLSLAAVAAAGPTEDIQDFDELDLESLLDVVFTASKHQQSIFWSPQPATGCPASTSTR
jgi:hypothetical protein